MLEGDRAFTTACLILHGECNRGRRDRAPVYEIRPGLFMTIALVTGDQLGPEMPSLFAEVVR